MTDWILAIEGTATGKTVALCLALLAAVLHAAFGALQKGRFNPWVMRGAIDVSYGLMALPFALFVVPFPEPHIWGIFAVVWVIHTAYKVLQAMTYTRGAYTVVYPVVRGTGPFFTVIGAYILFGEVFSVGQWFGVGVLLVGIFGLAAYNLQHVNVNRDTLKSALFLAILTGAFVALYTTYDAYGIRATPNPFTFLAWFFVLDSFAMPIVALLYVRKHPEDLDLKRLARRGVLGGLIAFASFGSILMATRLDKVGEAAVLRETSTIFAALFGWLFLREKVGVAQVALMALIAAGAVIVEFAS